MTQNPYSPPQAKVEGAPPDASESPLPGKPSGIGGWLLLPLFGLITSPIRVSVTFVTDLVPALEPEAWSRLTAPGSEVYDPMWAPLLIFEIVANIVLITFPIVLLWLFFRKSYRLPGLFIAWLLLHVGVQTVDLALASQVSAASGAISAGFKELARAIIGAAIWIPYFLKSVRVRNTFTKGRS